MGTRDVSVVAVQPRRIARAARRRVDALARRVQHRGRRAAHARGHRRPGALPRVRATAVRRRPPVPAGAVRELECRGLAVELNRISGGTPACLFNSFNFDFARLRRFAARGARLVHRVDGPIGVYRGFDDGTDERIARAQRRARRRDVLQSRFSLEKHVRARARAARPGRDPERRRPGDLPSTRDARAARGQAGPARRDELVGQPAEGRRRARLARPEPRPRALRGDVRRPAACGVRAHPRRRPARLARRSPT